MKKDEKVSERKKEFRTTVGGTVVNRVYTPADSEGLKEGDKLGESETLGLIEGERLGDKLGESDGLKLGDNEGLKLGDIEGESEGLRLGERLGLIDGLVETPPAPGTLASKSFVSIPVTFASIPPTLSLSIRVAVN